MSVPPLGKPKPRLAAMPAGNESEQADWAAAAKGMLKILRGRQDQFGVELGDLFGDPLYEMLLELYTNFHDGRPVFVGHLCVVSRLPQTTALRCIDQLIALDVIVKVSDPADGRRRSVYLTFGGVSVVEQHLATIVRFTKIFVPEGI